jgi:pimeloyl-ACP methyl ester carboxylesterase
MSRKFFSLDQFQEYFKSKRRGVPHLLSNPTDAGTTESFDGTPIHWELRGPRPSETKNPAMVFCYGLVCSMNQWRFQIERYSKEYPCITLDYRGHHESGIPAEKSSLNLSAIARDVAAVIEAAQVKKPAHIWGHSMGANVALELAVQEPQRVKSLLLVCGTPINPFKNMFNTSALEKVTGPLLDLYDKKPEVIETLWQVFLSEPRLAKWISSLVGFNAFASKSFDREAYALAVANIEPQVFFPLIRDLTRGMTQNILAQVKAPALVIAGSKDFITPPHVQKDLAENLPKGQYAEIPLGSHNVQLDFGEYVCLKVEEFWQKL